jgi:hypothetical protein
MSYKDEKGAENFKPTDNSVRSSLRYQIEAEKHLEAYSNVYNRRTRRASEDAAIFNFVGSLFKGVYYLLSAIIYLLFKKRKHE